jgi:hypothetical protein
LALISEGVVPVLSDEQLAKTTATIRARKELYTEDKVMIIN